MQIKSVHAIILKNSKILLVKRRDVPVWVLPGGGIEVNESELSAVTREVLEETGLTAVKTTKRANFIATNALCKNTALFICEVTGALLTQTSETKDAQYFSLDTLDALKIPPPYREFIKKSLASSKEFQSRIETVNLWVILSTILKHPILTTRFFLSRCNLHFNS